MAIEFPSAFFALIGRSPFLWQRRLFELFAAGEIPNLCDIPTGLGKTSVIPIWVVALACQAEAGRLSLPRRLVYVVNRRTVVDQATDDAMAIRAALRASDATGAAGELHTHLSSLCVDPNDQTSPLAISTLRGEFADNGEWRADPARPAIIVGTIDMIGSRLLFSGYGAGRSSRQALSAGLLGHDALLVHDEAHLSAPFGALVREIAAVQKRVGEPRPLQVLEMSATSQQPAGLTDRPAARVFELSEEEKAERPIARRLHARKSLESRPVDDPKSLPQKVVEAALKYEDGKARILVYLQSPDVAKDVAKRLTEAIEKEHHKSAKNRVALLTGTLRGKERDELASSDLFQKFKAAPDRAPIEQSIFLIATSAGEVGVNLDADHMICDLTSLDSIIQRLGRVNRLGREGDSFTAEIEIFEAPSGKVKDGDVNTRMAKLETARQNTAKALKDLPGLTDGGHDASSQVLRALVDAMKPQELTDAFAPQPRIVPCTGILLDTWALTSVRELPGSLPVDRWLHGIESDPPETIVAWREEAAEIAVALKDSRISDKQVRDWFDAHGIESQERLREPTYRAARQFEVMANRLKKFDRSLSALVLRGGKLKAVAIDELCDMDQITDATVVLPLGAGGLRDGMLDGAHMSANDVADVTLGKRSSNESDESAVRRRWRAWISRQDGEWRVTPFGYVQKHIGEKAKAFNESQRAGLSIERAIQGLIKTAPQTQFVEEGRLPLTPEDDPDATFRVLVSFVPAKSAETALSKSEAAPREQELDPHLREAARFAVVLANNLQLPSGIADALRQAARFHDTGKARPPWQRAIGNRRYHERLLAKSDHRRFMVELCENYRHEFGSLVDAMQNPALADHAERDVILHLIASHHGWGRPHFKSDLDDPCADGERIAAALAETPRRYARLQRRFGRWGLAWLEALMKAADVMATKSITPEAESDAVRFTEKQL